MRKVVSHTRVPLIFWKLIVLSSYCLGIKCSFLNTLFYKPLCYILYQYFLQVFICLSNKLFCYKQLKLEHYKSYFKVWVFFSFGGNTRTCSEYRVLFDVWFFFKISLVSSMQMLTYFFSNTDSFYSMTFFFIHVYFKW